MAHLSHSAHTDFPNYPKGFSFENFKRNELLLNNSKLSSTLPKVKKTGTTICGAVFNGGVVLGADTRSTSELVVEKNCEKIHYIAPNIWCCGAGTAADTEFTTAQISSQLELLRLNSGMESRVITAMTMLKRHLFNYQGNVSAALILGGVDVTGSHVYTVYPHGSIDKLPYVTMGSGSLAAMSVMETHYKDNMTKEECIRLIEKAVAAGVFNDLGSGSNVNYTVITKDGVETFKGTDLDAKLGEVARSTVLANDVKLLKQKVNKPKFFAQWPKGTTEVVSETVETF